MNKKDFREKQKAILLDYAKTNQKKEEDQLLTDKFLQLKSVKRSLAIAVTISMPMEVSTQRLIKQLWQMGKQVYAAKVVPGKAHQMNFLQYTPNSELILSKFRVKEVALPAKINNNPDLLLVPGLAFSVDGHQRIGFGGGYYDRFLAKHDKIKTIALANSKMIFPKAKWPTEKTDIPIDTIVACDQIY